MRSKHFPECAQDCYADERGLQIAQASPAYEGDDDLSWYAFYSHDTIGQTYEGEPCYGAAFEVLAEGDTRGSVEVAVFWLEVADELEVIGRVIDERADLPGSAFNILPNGGGNIPCGLFFRDSGSLTSYAAYAELKRDVLPDRLVYANTGRERDYLRLTA